MPLEVDGLGPDQDLERGCLGVQELGAAGEQLLLGGVVGAGQRRLGADDVQHRHGVCRWRPRTEAGHAALQCRQIETCLDGGTHGEGNRDDSNVPGSERGFECRILSAQR